MGSVELRVLEDAWRDFSPQQRSALELVASRVTQLLPGAEITGSWGMPTFRIDGDLVLSIQGFSDHNSVFPGTEVIETLADRLSSYVTTKGTIHFDRDKPMPVRDVKAIVNARIRTINDSYPRKSGQFKEFFANGRVKARGRMKGAVMSGSWEWFRKDGSMLRSGSFRSGERVGVWVTYDVQGEPYKTTHM